MDHATIKVILLIYGGVSMRVTLLCFCGITTGILLAGMKEVACPEDEISAYDYGRLKDVVDRSDVVLLGPQLRDRLVEVEKLCGAKGIPCGLISVKDYANMDGKNVYCQAKTLVEEE